MYGPEVGYILGANTRTRRDETCPAKGAGQMAKIILRTAANNDLPPFGKGALVLGYRLG